MSGNGKAPTYIAVTFWGEEYRRFFLDYCLSTLMAPGNIPAIQNKAAARLLIATRNDDWQAMQSEPIFVAARQHIAIEQIPFEAELNPAYDKKMSIMSEGHKLLTRRMFEDRARGVIVFPDFIFADGAIRRIEQLADDYKVILCICVRFANEGLLNEPRLREPIARHEPVVLGTQELVRLALRNMHSELVRLNFDADMSDRGGSSLFWVVAPGQDLLFHTSNWQPVLIDYSSLEVHDDTTFDNWTIDGDYVAKNFSNSADVYVVRNTSELFLSGFAPEAKVSYSTARFLPYRFAALRSIMKVFRIREFLVRFCVLDHLKKEFFRIPIRVQGGDSSEAAWRDAERRAAVVVEQIEQGSIAFSAFYWSAGVFRVLLQATRRGRSLIAAFRS